MKNWLRLILFCSFQSTLRAQFGTGFGGLPGGGAPPAGTPGGLGGPTGGIPYPNQVTDIGVACLQYDNFAKRFCKPTPTEGNLFRARCDQWRLYCKGLQAPSATTPDPQGLVPAPPPDVCPQITYCAQQKGQYSRVCYHPADQDSVNFCTRYSLYCANVPPDADGACTSEMKQQEQFFQRQRLAMIEQQRAVAAQTAFAQPFNGNPLPFSQASSGMPGSFSGTGIIGRRKRQLSLFGVWAFRF